MSFSIKYQHKDGRILDLNVLDRVEYSKLNNDEKLDYNAQPLIDDTSELGIQSFIWGIIEQNDSGDNGLPEILDAFMKESYPEAFNSFIDKVKGSDSSASWSDRTEYFWSVIDEIGDEALDASDIYFLDYAYKSDFIYGLIEDECERLQIGNTKRIQ